MPGSDDSALAYALVAMLVLLVGYLATGLYLRWASQRALLDHPGARSSHQLATVTGGGAGIVAGVLSGWVFLTLAARMPPVEPLLGALLLALLGAADDRKALPVSLRLAIQWFAAVALLVSVFRHDLTSPASIAWLIGVSVMLVWLTNLYNFMDGIDGLAAVQGFLIAAAAVVLLPTGSVFVPLLITLMAACAAFLLFNWPPARLFMGDTGSLFIGFLLGSVALISSRSGELEFVTWMILWAGFVADTSVTLMLRIWRREAWYRSHRQHAYQRLALRWRHHRRVTLAALVLNLCWLWPLAALSHNFPGWSVLAAMLAYLPLVIVVCYVDSQAWDSEAAKMPESAKTDTATRR